jgi:hypothetical protein
LCREEAHEVSARAADLKAAGASRIVALVKEDIGEEVAAFRAGYWSQEVFLDADKRFFLALGGGQAHVPYSAAGFVAMMLNPFAKTRSKSSMARASVKKVEGNMTVGEGLITGGVYVVRQDGKAAYRFLEEEHGDHAVVDDVIEGVKAAVNGEEFVLAPQLPEERSSSTSRKTWKESAGRTTGPDRYVVGDITRIVRNSSCSIM